MTVNTSYILQSSLTKKHPFRFNAQSFQMPIKLEIK